MAEKAKMSKDVVPEGFTISMAIVDGLPVLFFSLAFILFGLLIKDCLFIFGAIVCLLSGIIKVFWKMIVAVKKKNIWWMFVQMRIAMPAGFIIMIIGFIISLCSKDLSAQLSLFLNIPCLIFAILGVLGIIGMIVLAMKLDSSDPKSNWIEQICNSIAQACFCICVLIALL